MVTISNSSMDNSKKEKTNLTTNRPRKKNNIQKNDSKKFQKKLNVVLIVINILFGSILLYMILDFQKNGDKNNISIKYNENDKDYNYIFDQELEDENNLIDNFIPIVKSVIPSREAGNINGHDHIQSFNQAPKWLMAMDQVGISTTIMLGSPDATFLQNPSGKFNKYLENNEELFKLISKYPERFIAFPTIYTFDNNKLELLNDYIERGAIGLKLFSGHYASFYDVLGPLNHSTMFPIYEYCESLCIPIIWHVNLGIDSIKAEFEDVLENFPNLIINVPHFMLSSTDLWQSDGQGRLRYFLETYPNLYTDISFGYWVKTGFWRISNHTKVFKNFIIEFQDRFTYGTDMVCTDHPRKDVEWISNLTQGYKDILEKEYFNITVKDDMKGDFNGDAPGTHNGLNLPKNILNKIYYDNIVKFLNGRFYYENLTEVINESNLTYQDSFGVKSDEKTFSRGISDDIPTNFLVAIDIKKIEIK